MIKNRKILITGGAGFIGSNMAESLYRNNDVTLLDNLSGGNLENISSFSDKVKFINGDIRNKDTFEKIREDFDLVIHLAANSDVRAGSTDTKSDMEINVLGTHNLLEFMRKRDVKHLMFSSTSTVYGEADVIPTPENYGPCLTISLYGASKLANEGFIWSYYHYYGIRPTIYRFANIVGRNSTHGVIHDFIIKLKKDPRELEILGDGRQEKSYMHIDDCVGAMLHIYEKDTKGDVVNLGNDERTSVTRIAEIVRDAMKLNDVRFHYTGGIDGRGWAGDIKIAQLSIEKMKQYGWKNRYNSEESVVKATDEIVRQMK
ncbi:MAG: NAD-dependent epimerase/dehydratase family protein [Candidatus Thermoplasmatota archaeon]|jgi:UDP-glucose 4-epimerase|nr:NAD-dependent epimerase/dehydratase family protein [Candidatus Thermoplasmatota archaeon]